METVPLTGVLSMRRTVRLLANGYRVAVFFFLALGTLPAHAGNSPADSLSSDLLGRWLRSQCGRLETELR